MSNTTSIKNKYISLIFCIVITAAYFVVLICLYQNQLDLDAPVKSDILGHIEFGLSGSRCDSVMFSVLAFLWQFSNHCSFVVALFLSIFSILSVFLTYILIKDHVSSISKKYLYLAAFICNIYMPIHIPCFNASPYAGMFGFNLWHNSTYIAMKPFAIVSIILFFRLISSYKTKPVSVAEFMCFSGILFITSLFKLSFAFGFMPCLLVIMIIDFIKGKGRNILNYILFGVTMLPTGLLMIWQRIQLFDQTNEIGFDFLKIWLLYTDSPLISLGLSLAFPLIILIFNYKDLIRCKIYQFSWFFALVNILIFACLCEFGPREMHGNFGWGTHFAVGLLFVVSMCKFLNQVKNMSKFRLILISSILGMHMLCGINYIIRFFCENTYI